MPSCDPGGVAAGGSSGTDEPASRTVPSAVGAKLRTELTLRWGVSCPGSPSGLGAQLCYVCGPDGGEGPQRPPCGRGARDARPGAVASGDQLRGGPDGHGGACDTSPQHGPASRETPGPRGRPSLTTVQLAAVLGICSRRLVLAWDVAPGGGPRWDPDPSR